MRFGPKEVKTIRSVAEKEAKRWSRARRFRISIGVRYNTVDSSRPRSTNIALVTDQPDRINTDLYDRVSWEHIRCAYDLCPEGRAEFDLYINEVDPEYPGSGDLVCNVQVEADRQGLRVIRAERKVLWTRA